CKDIGPGGAPDCLECLGRSACLQLPTRAVVMQDDAAVTHDVGIGGRRAPDRRESGAERAGATENLCPPLPVIMEDKALRRGRQCAPPDRKYVRRGRAPDA